MALSPLIFIVMKIIVRFWAANPVLHLELGSCVCRELPWNGPIRRLTVLFAGV